MNKQVFPRACTLSAVLALLMLLALLISGCAQKTAVQPAEATQPAAAIPAATDTQVPTATTEPTSTPTAEPTATETPEPTATATPDLKATVAAEQTQAAQVLVDKIKPDLEAYGLKPEDGHLVWASDADESIKLETTTYLETKYLKLDKVGEIGDFVIQSKVRWVTTSGLASCAIIFRSEKDIDQGKQAFFYFIRLQSAPAWDVAVKEFGQFKYSLPGDWVFTNHLNDKNDSINTVALVVKGINITPYLNGSKERLVEETKLKDGYIALASYQESGITTCTFKDTWVWAIDK